MNKGRQGFTLIEILIVVAIIAILASVVLVGLGPTQRAGRDARRLSDIRQVQNGLELFYNKCGYYPGAVSAGACSAGAPPATWSTMGAMLTNAGLGVSSVPGDPSANRSYGYAWGTGNTAYVLGVALEDPNNSVFNGYTAPTMPVGAAWVTDATSIVPNTTCDKTLPAGSATYCVAL